MTYDLILTGNKTLSITQDQKDKLDRALLDKEGNGNISFTLGRNTIRLSMVKAILESTTVNFRPMSEFQEHQHEEWNDMCCKMAKLPIKDKIDNEITFRILPLFKKSTISENTMTVLRQSIEAFFTSHTNYPRCPSIVWWEIVNPFVDKDQTLFMQYVIRNDSAIEEYVKYHKV